MKYTRKDYEGFLNTELEAQVKEYEQVVSTKALVLKERGDVFVGRFITLQPSDLQNPQCRQYATQKLVLDCIILDWRNG